APQPPPGHYQYSKGLDGTAGAAAGTARAGVELDDEPVAPAVFAPRARLDVAHQRGRRLGPHDSGAPGQIRKADSPAYARLDQEVLHPLRAQAVLRDQVVAPAATREPDFDLARATALPAPRREIEEFLLFAGGRWRHAPAMRARPEPAV